MVVAGVVAAATGWSYFIVGAEVMAAMAGWNARERERERERERFRRGAAVWVLFSRLIT
jgi:hypothetical protein